MKTKTGCPPSHAQISALAESLWREKGCPGGCDDEIWLESERLLIGRLRRTKRNAKDAAALADPRFSFNRKPDDLMGELDRRFAPSAARETTSL
jgi:hypothetical protein